MGEPLGDRVQWSHDSRPDAIIRPLARAGGRTCVRPGCPAPASATLIFDYPQRHASLGILDDRSLPESYDLCGHHADRTGAPIGWRFEDLRPEGMRPAPAPGGDETVAILTAVLGRGAAADDPVLLDVLESVDRLLAVPEGGDDQQRALVSAQDTIDELRAFVDAQDTMDELRALLAGDAPLAPAPVVDIDATPEPTLAAPAPPEPVAAVVPEPVLAVVHAEMIATTVDVVPAPQPAPPRSAVLPIGARALAW